MFDFDRVPFGSRDDGFGACLTQFSFTSTNRRDEFRMKFIAKIEIDVENADTESEGRKAAYDLVATLNATKKGRTPAGPRACVCGIAVQVVEGGKEKASGDVMESAV